MTHTARLLVLSLVLFLTVLHANAQDYQAKKDSLLKVIPTLAGKARLEAYEELCKQLFFYEPDVEVILPIYEAWEQEIEKLGDTKLQRDVKLRTIAILVNRQHYDAFLERVGDVLAFSEAHDLCDDSYYNMQNSRLAALYGLGRLAESLSEAKEIYQAAKRRGHPAGQTMALLRMGETYYSLRRFPEAEACYRECLALQNKESPHFNQGAGCYMGLLDIKIQQKRGEEALALLPLWEDWLRKRDEVEKGYNNYNWKQYYFVAAYVYSKLGDTNRADVYLQKSDSIPVSHNGLVNTSSRSCVRASILAARKQYAEALPLLQVPLTDKEPMIRIWAMEEKASILSRTGRGEEALTLFIQSQELKDSIANLSVMMQLDELRTEYEVDRHIAEKERQHLYFLFALGASCLLAVALGIWIYYSRKVTRKNRILAAQIKEQAEWQERQIQEVLARTTFVPRSLPEPGEPESDCPENRKDKLCIQIRELILRDKLYLDPAITRDDVIARLGTYKNLFVDAFQECFGMSFNDYITTLRLKDALSLLVKTDLSIEEISLQSGFGTARTLRRQFNDKYGMSPADYRRLQN